MPELVRTKTDLLEKMDSAWTDFTQAINLLTEPELVGAIDNAGWTVKDHLIHLAAWERSVIFLLQHRPRHEGLGVPEEVYLQGGEDEINAAIQNNMKELPLGEVMATLFIVHEQLTAAVQALTDEDLQKPYRHYLSDEPGEGDGPPVINTIYGNTVHHFREHLPWIEELARKA